MLMPSREELDITTVDDEAPINSNNTTPHRPLHLSRSVGKKLDQMRLDGIMRKIPVDAEATSVLVGEVDFLSKPALVFVRLAEGTMLENFSEVPIPVRFVFVLLGPSNMNVDYHELGRCFSTLMSSEVCLLEALLFARYCSNDSQIQIKTEMFLQPPSFEVKCFSRCSILSKVALGFCPIVFIAIILKSDY